MSAARARLLHRPRWPLAVAAVVALAFVLRLWGVKHGLPYVYNTDENAHFVPKAIGFFGNTYNPQYFINPPAFTYLLHVVFAVWFGGREGVSEAYATNPTEVFVVARVTAAVLGTVGVWLLYLAGARLFDRRTGLLGAGLLAVAFLPVFYSHLALNDVPTLAPIALALWGTAGVLRHGRGRDWVIAGIGLGLACASKYTGGIVLLPLLGAAAVRWREDGPGAVVPWLAAAAAISLAMFVAANPYALLDYDAFRDGLDKQSSASGEQAGKLGLTEDNGWAYYLWTLTWGVGFVPAFAALGGIALLIRERSPLALVLVPAPALFILFMGSQERFFGRWLLPVIPIVCLLAAYAVWRAVDAASARPRRAWRPTFSVLGVVLLCGQGFLFSAHNDLILSRDDTRKLARDWLVENVPAGTKIVVEPVAPDQWAHDVGRPSPVQPNGQRWVKFPVSKSLLQDDGTVRRGVRRIVNIEDYEKILRPRLVDVYQRGGYCWVVSGSTQSGRAFVEPDEVPAAIRYYRSLARNSEVAYSVSPYGKGEPRVKFNFDWSFDYYPLSYERPGPEITIYRLRGGRCG